MLVTSIPTPAERDLHFLCYLTLPVLINFLALNITSHKNQRKDYHIQRWQIEQKVRNCATLKTLLRPNYTRILQPFGLQKSLMVLFVFFWTP